MREPAPLTWRDLVTRYRERLVRRAASVSTITVEMRAVRDFTAQLTRLDCRILTDLRPAHLAAFAAWLPERRVPWGHRRGERWAPHSVLVTTNVVRRFLRWVARADYTLVDWGLWLASIKVPRTLPRVLSLRDVERLLAAARDTDDVTLRDRAVLELFYASGLRVSELVSLDLADLDLRGGEVLVRQGKGRRDRRVPMGPAAVRALTAYLQRARDRASVQRTGIPSPAVFLSARGTRLSVASAEALVRRRAADAGLGRITPHTLRHTAAVHLLRGGADVRHIQVFLGHASVATTVRYTRLTLDDLRHAVTRAHPRSRLRLTDR